MKNEREAIEVWLVRHPETDWNLARRYQGRSDRPLTERGRAQLDALRDFFSQVPVCAIVTTGLTRTDAVAHAIGDCHRAAEVRVDRRLIEIDHGLWEGLTYPEVVERFGADAQQRLDDPVHSRVHCGETLVQLAERVAAAWLALTSQAHRSVVVVTHATPVQALLCQLLAAPLDHCVRVAVDLGSVTRVVHHPQGSVVRCVNALPPQGNPA